MGSFRFRFAAFAGAGVTSFESMTFGLPAGASCLRSLLRLSESKMFGSLGFTGSLALYLLDVAEFDAPCDACRLLILF